MAKTTENKSSVVQIIPKRIAGSKRIFSNHIRVARVNTTEISLQFSDVKPAENDEEQQKILKEKRVEVTIDCEIVAPIGVIKNLIKALESQVKINEK